MKIIKLANWDDSEGKAKMLNLAKQDAIETAERIKSELENKGFIVPSISVKEKVCINVIKDGDNNLHNVNIELKPWANKNNKVFEMRNGIILMVGPYSHKKFKRKRFSPKNLCPMMNYIDQLVKYTVDMERLRQRRSEKAEKARAKKFEASFLGSI
jgi:hypothetical protein